mmetsp:Transcript_11058/g.20446  ORF Transcript_11058/g.20446 Transcript_11058/m.20446 type:complete len:124 (+) Transcript_11058:119-490(+)
MNSQKLMCQLDGVCGMNKLSAVNENSTPHVTLALLGGMSAVSRWFLENCSQFFLRFLLANFPLQRWQTIMNTASLLLYITKDRSPSNFTSSILQLIFLCLLLCLALLHFVTVFELELRLAYFL